MLTCDFCFFNFISSTSKTFSQTSNMAKDLDEIPCQPPTLGFHFFFNQKVYHNQPASFLILSDVSVQALLLASYMFYYIYYTTALLRTYCPHVTEVESHSKRLSNLTKTSSDTKGQRQDLNPCGSSSKAHFPSVLPPYSVITELTIFF